MGQLLQRRALKRPSFPPTELNSEFTWHLWKKNQSSIEVCVLHFCALSTQLSVLTTVLRCYIVIAWAFPPGPAKILDQIALN